MKARMISTPTSRVPMSRGEITEIVNEEFIKKKHELYSSVVQDITVQVLATVLVTLELWYGWKKERLKKLIETIHSEEEDMVMNNLTTIGFVERLKAMYGIDLMEEFPAHMETLDKILEREVNT